MMQYQLMDFPRQPHIYGVNEKIGLLINNLKLTHFLYLDSNPSWS